MSDIEAVVCNWPALVGALGLSLSDAAGGHDQWFSGVLISAKPAMQMMVVLFCLAGGHQDPYYVIIVHSARAGPLLLNCFGLLSCPLLCPFSRARRACPPTMLPLSPQSALTPC